MKADPPAPKPEHRPFGRATDPAGGTSLGGKPADSRIPLVLLADDFEDAREIYGEYLRFSGIHVLTASSGQEAVQLALEHAPDVILMDIRMPGMTGTEAMHALRRDARFRSVPIVALTAHALESERAAMLAEGFDGVISKPCLPQELLAALRELLSEHTGTVR